MRIKNPFEKITMLWLIVSLKHETKIEFRTKRMWKWLFEKLMKNKKITSKFIKSRKLRGYSYNRVWVDEIK